MTVKDVLKITALLLNRTDIKEYLEGEKQSVGEDAISAVNTMTSLCNLVVNELASTYVPMVKEEKVYASGGKIYYKDLSENVLEIIKISNLQGSEIRYGFHHEYVTVGVDNALVEYEYSPTNKGLDEEIGYEEKDVSARVLAYGVAAEFCITEGEFDEAVMWHKRYVDGINELYLPKNSVLKSRRWV